MNRLNFKKLRGLMSEYGYTNETFAKIMRTNHVTVSHWKTGKLDPVTNQLCDMAEIFKCDINDLVNKED